VTYALSIELPGLPPCNTASNNHWRVRARHNRRWRLDTILAAKAAGLPPKPLWRATVTCTRHSSREPDFENLAHSFKPCLDALTVRNGGAPVLVDDSQEVIGQPTYLWEKAPPKEGRITLEVVG
jgi:hypothetical protein